MRLGRRTGALVILSALVLTVLLAGCVKMSPRAETQGDTRSWAQSHASLLADCGKELLARYPEKPKWTGAEYEVSLIREDWIELWHGQSRELLSFHSAACRELLENSVVQRVLLRCGQVRFSLGGEGFGSQTTYFDVYYLPTDDFSGCLGYNAAMTFNEQDGGWFGRYSDPSVDNTFFYQSIGEHLYYCIAHF